MLSNLRSSLNEPIVEKFVIAVDNDDAGERRRKENPDLPFIIPVYKDWNEDLMRGAYYGKEQSEKR